MRLEVDSLKILAPREPTERNVNMSLLSSPSNEGPMVLTDDEDDQTKARSCLFCCWSRSKRRSSRSSSKKDKRKEKYMEVHQPKTFDNSAINGQQTNDHIISSSSSNLRVHSDTDLDNDPSYNNPNPHHRTKSKEQSSKDRRSSSKSAKNRSNNQSNISSSSSLPSSTPKTTGSAKKQNKKKSKHKSSGKTPDVPSIIHESVSLHEIPDVAFRSDSRDSKNRNSSRSGKSGTKSAPKTTTVPRDLALSSPAGQSDCIIMEYDSHLELVKLRAGQDELASPTRQAGPIGILVEQWAHSGKHFLIKADLLCQSIVDQFHMDIVKHFEQDRGTLVLDVISEGTAVVVINICTTKTQVKRLQEEHENGRLLERLQELFTSKIDLTKFDIRGANYRTHVDESQLQNVLSEL